MRARLEDASIEELSAMCLSGGVAVLLDWPAGGDAKGWGSDLTASSGLSFQVEADMLACRVASDRLTLPKGQAANELPRHP